MPSQATIQQAWKLILWSKSFGQYLKCTDAIPLKVKLKYKLGAEHNTYCISWNIFILVLITNDKTTDKYHCYVLGNVPNTDVVESFKSEEELLQRLYQKYLEINPTILSGWNIDGFDIPYLYNRTVRVLGQQFANSLSPIGEVFYSEHKKRYKIAGVSVLDYLALYKTFTFSQRSSYRLDDIANYELGEKKISYDGTLNDLYENDIDKFVQYNLQDVKLVKKLDEKLDFIEVARGLAHLGHCPYEDVFMSSRYLEGAILVYLRKNSIVAPNKPKRSNGRGF